MKIAIVHDWLTGMRGGEKCLEVFCELFPRATLFTLVHRKGALSPAIESMEIRTSFIQKLPGALTLHQRYLPLFPRAIESLDLSEFDFVLSTSHCVAKGAIPRHDATHVCYCHTPMRYVWDFYDDYFRGPSAGLGARVVMPVVAPWLRRWDVRTSSRVDQFVANSRNVAERIRRLYDRDAHVIYPPVDTERFTPAPARESAQSTPRGAGGYLVVSKLVPYKHVEIAVEAANALAAPLRVIGDGPERARLEAIAGPSVSFEGWVDDATLAEAYRGARALLFPGIEDFGIVPLEAQACGTPVIAFGAGGSLETVRDGETGVLFTPQSAAALVKAMQRLDALDLDPAVARAWACRFSRERFREETRAYLASILGADFTSSGVAPVAGIPTRSIAAAAGSLS
jgi:glycosyltransferase involved in cell wall biosynthesis